jgi:hypothetical protein
LQRFSGVPKDVEARYLQMELSGRQERWRKDVIRTASEPMCASATENWTNNFMSEFPRLMWELRNALTIGDVDSMLSASAGVAEYVSSLGSIKALLLARNVDFMARSRNFVQASHVFTLLELELAGLLFAVRELAEPLYPLS